MAYSTLPTVNPNDVLSSSTWGNIVRANEEALYSGRPGSAIYYDGGATKTTTSTAFTPVDSTNLSVTLTVGSGKIAFGFTCAMQHSAAGRIYLDVEVDGVRVGGAGADGLITKISGSGPTPEGVSLNGMKTGLSVASHVIRPVWRVDSGTGSLFSGNGVGGQDFIPHFWAEEIG
jgi:hypothetical protein